VNRATVSSATHDPQPADNEATAETFVASANLSLTKTASPDPVVAGSPLVYTLTVSNAGPTHADAVRVADTLPAGVALVSASPSAGSCALGPTVTCDVGRLEAGASATVAIVVVPQSPGTLRNRAAVSSPTADPEPRDDEDVATAEVLATDLSVTAVDAPDPVRVGHLLTYLVTVRNGGPAAATDASLTLDLPTGAELISTRAERGRCTRGPGRVACSLGRMLPLATLTVGVVVRPTVSATARATARVDAAEPDTSPANDVAEIETAVVYRPTLLLAPPLGTPGAVLVTAGFGFPSEARVELAWRPGVGRATVRTDTGGRFRVHVLVLRRDVLGRRRLLATPAAGSPSFEEVSAPFLVTPGTGVPSDFVQRR
jgi:uncharacterized repeat protein (TIGR01451 family)